MVALWMCYATLVTALLAAAAWAADRTFATLGGPRRWAWAAAAAGGVAFPAWGAWRGSHDATAPRIPVLTPAVVVGDAPPAAARPGRMTARVHAPPRAPGLAVAGAAFRAAVAAAADRATPLDRPLLALWLLASTTGVAALAHGAWAVRRRGRRWRPAVVGGESVWLAPDLGPALVGTVRPRMVLPTWLLDVLDAEELRLVLAHERAHAAARDPLLLAFALGALVAAPWNAALWPAVRRLRLAAEADCDRRVLRAHPGARRYARVLVAVAERALGGAPRAAPCAPSVVALLDPPGLLERRVAWLLRPERPAPRGRRAAGALGALGAAALACAAPRPTHAPSPEAARTVEPLARFDSTASACASRPACQDSATLAMLRAADAATAADLARFDSAGKRVEAMGAHLDSAAPSLAAAVARINAAAARMNAELGRMNVEAERMQKYAARTQTSLVRTGVVPGLPSDSNGVPTPAALRALVDRHFPEALRSGMGAKPFVWFAFDARGRVVNTATGPAGLLAVEPQGGSWPTYDPIRTERVTSNRAPVGRELVVDAKAVHLKFPGLFPDPAVGLVRTHLEVDGDSVQVILVAPPASR